MNNQQIYNGIGRLIETAPFNKEMKEIQQWSGSAYAYSQQLNEVLTTAAISSASKFISMKFNTYNQINIILGELYKLLAIAELKVPAPSQGAFIPAGNTFDAMAAVSKVLSQASTSALIVDPYMDEKVLTDFALLAKETVAINLLTDSANVKPTLVPAATRWKGQYDTIRPLTVKAAITPRSLHDRLIIIDEHTVWTLTQSLNAFAARSPATIVRIEGDAVPLKLAAYADFWANGTILI